MAQTIVDNQSVSNAKKLNADIEKIEKTLNKIVQHFSEINKKAETIQSKLKTSYNSLNSMVGLLSKNPLTEFASGVEKLDKATKFSNINTNLKNIFTNLGKSDWYDSLSQGASESAEKMKTAYNSVKDVLEQNKNNSLENIEKIKSASSEAGNQFKKLGNSIGNALDIEGKKEKILNGFQSIKIGVSGKLAEISNFIGNIVGTIGNKLAPITSAIGGVFSTIANTLGNVFSTIIGQIGTFLEPIRTMFSSLIETVLTPFKNFFEPILAQFSGFHLTLGMIVVVIALIAAALVDLWNNNEEWKNKVLEAWENIQLVLMAVYTNVIEPIFNSIKDLCVNVWENGLQPLWSEFVNLIDIVTSVFLDFWNFVSPYVTELLEFLGPILKDTFDFLGTFIGNTLNGVLGIITTVIGAATGVFKGIIDFISGVFSTDWSQAWEGVKQIFSGIWETLSGIVSGVWSTILGLFANGGQIFSGVVDGISGAFKNIANTIIKGINDVIRVPFDKVNGLLNSIRSFNIPPIGQPFLGLWSYNPLPIPVIPTLARGGFANLGQLFIANEPGNPELIGNIGGRTAVVNNQMILDGIQSAMRNAIIEGMSLSYGQNSQGDTYVDVYIDGVFTERKLMKANERHMLRTGKPVFAKG